MIINGSMIVTAKFDFSEHFTNEELKINLHGNSEKLQELILAQLTRKLTFWEQLKHLFVKPKDLFTIEKLELIVRYDG